MTKQIFVNLPVRNLNESTEFYRKLGFSLNPSFSNESSSCMVWSDDILVMLLKHDFYQSYIAEKEVADTKRTSGVLLCLSMESREAVENFAQTAKQNGGDFYMVESGVPTDKMFGLEVQDLDGHNWEPMWISPDVSISSEE